MSKANTIRVAAGTAAVLGLASLKQTTLPKTAHLLMHGRCVFNCDFCTQASSVPEGADEKLSRISWPAFEKSEVLAALEKNLSKFNRVCLQTVNTEEGFPAILSLVEEIRKAVDIPFSVDLRITDSSQVEKLLSVGVDVVGLPTDAASDVLFEEVRGGSLDEHYLEIEEMARKFPKKISTHIVIGLGETEREAIELLAKFAQAAVSVGLFALTPMPDTPMEDCTPPVLASYRKIQAAYGLLCENYTWFDRFKFDNDGRLLSFGTSNDSIENILKPAMFETSGCKDCNRPYYNEKPGDVPYNYPYTPSEEEFKSIIEMLKEELK